MIQKVEFKILTLCVYVHYDICASLCVHIAVAESKQSSAADQNFSLGCNYASNFLISKILATLCMEANTGVSLYTPSVMGAVSFFLQKVNIEGPVLQSHLSKELC